MATGNLSRLRGLISSAANAAISEDDSDDFESILQTTRRCFRPNLNPSRGRKAFPYFRKKTFLLRRFNSDYLPIKGECEHLSRVGLGYSSEDAKYYLNWSLDQIENYVCSLYPHVPLDLVGFKLGRVDRSKKITVLVNINGGEDLKQQLTQSQLIVIPNRDLPVRAPTEAVTARINDPPTSRPVVPVNVNPRVNPRVDVTTATSSSYVDFLDMDHSEDFQYEGQNNDNNTYFIDMPFDLSLSADENHEELLVEIDRNDVVDQLLEIYDKESSILQKTLKVHFRNEEGDDFGGLTKELFTIFWEGCKEKFFHGESVCVPKLELHRKNKDIKKFATLGKILTHMMLLTKTIPNFIARSTYLRIGNLDFSVSKETVKEDFMYFITHSERELLKKAQSSYNTLELFERTLLEEFFATNNFFDIPKSEEINDQIGIIAENIMIVRPTELIKTIKEGIPLLYENVWVELTLDKLNGIMIEQSATPDKVVQCLETSEDDLTSHQSSALYYLKTYIRNLKREQLSQFLYFVTGSCNMPNKIQISFSNINGASRRPIVHTCSNLLELPTTYTGFQDLSREFNAILNNDMSFPYTQL